MGNRLDSCKIDGFRMAKMADFLCWVVHERFLFISFTFVINHGLWISQEKTEYGLPAGRREIGGEVRLGDPPAKRLRTSNMWSL